jgi:hypothetical protein
VDGELEPNIGLNAVAGKDPKDFGLDPVRFDEMLPGCYDVNRRLADMDLDGVHAQLCFPSFPGFAGSTFFGVENKDLATACVLAWNDFILDEWSAAAPGRMIPMVMVPFWDVDAAVVEVQRTAAKGAKAITFTEAPHRLGLPRATTRTATATFRIPARSLKRCCRTCRTRRPARSRSSTPGASSTSPASSRSSFRSRPERRQPDCSREPSDVGGVVSGGTEGRRGQRKDLGHVGFEDEPVFRCGIRRRGELGEVVLLPRGIRPSQGTLG